MKIGLYFGSFNPIHIGHLIVAEFVANHTHVQQVWFVVSPQNPFKQSASLLNEYQRLHLVNLAIDHNERLKASDVEFKLPKPSYTIHTLTYLAEKYPQHSFSIIMGSDSFKNLPKWKHAELLIANYPFLVYNRPGFFVDDTYGAKLTILDAPLLEISATNIRSYIQQQKSIRYLVPDAVIKEIESAGYYR
jgi:nicotinate-nucleotide adenylyltransferase